MPPPKVWLPNFPLRLKLKPPPMYAPYVDMPKAGTEGTFKTTELVFETVQQMSKLEIKRFLITVYGIDVKRVHSLNVLGRRRGENTTMPVKEKDFKRFYVKLNDQVELPTVPKSLEEVKQSAN